MIDLVRISALEKIIKDRYGLTLKDTDIAELKSTVRSRMADLKLRAFSDYLSLISDGGREDELDYLVSRITIGETSFFRTPPQFWALRDFVLPQLLKAKQANPQKKIRVLSAGCATGEEPYSLGIILREKICQELGWKVEIIAVDVNRNFLKIAQQGIYQERDLRNLDEHLKVKYFEQKGSEFHLKKELKSLVEFRHFNLAERRYDVLAQAGAFDIIFCRNVLIYFDSEAFLNAINNFYRIMQMSGYLFLGYSESLYGLDSKFEGIYAPEAFFYKKIPEAKEQLSCANKPAKAKVIFSKPVLKAQGHRHKTEPAKMREPTLPAKQPVVELLSAEQLWSKGYQLFEDEEYDQAHKCFEALMESFPNSPMGYLGMAFLLANQGEDELSANYLRLAFEKDSLLPETYYLLGLLAERKEEWEKAIQNYERAIFLKSDFVIVHFNLASLFLRLSELRSAERELKVVLGLLKSSGDERVYLSGVWSRKALREWAEIHLQKLKELRK